MVRSHWMEGTKFTKYPQNICTDTVTTQLVCHINLFMICIALPMLSQWRHLGLAEIGLNCIHDEYADVMGMYADVSR